MCSASRMSPEGKAGTYLHCNFLVHVAPVMSYEWWQLQAFKRNKMNIFQNILNPSFSLLYSYYIFEEQTNGWTLDFRFGYQFCEVFLNTLAFFRKQRLFFFFIKPFFEPCDIVTRWSAECPEEDIDRSNRIDFIKKAANKMCGLFWSLILNCNGNN